MIDEPDALMDERIANHIVAVHQRRDLALDAPYRMPQIQTYIRFARTIRPELTEEVGGQACNASYAFLDSIGSSCGIRCANSISVKARELTCLPGCACPAFTRSIQDHAAMQTAAEPGFDLPSSPPGLSAKYPAATSHPDLPLSRY